jgi:NAD(P)H dehydrogenase (quinone)
MGSVAAGFKSFMEETTPVWLERKWQDKIAAGFTTSHALSGDKLTVLIQMAVFAAQHGMIWIGPTEMQRGSGRDDVNRLGSFLGVMACSDTKDPPPVPSNGDRESAFLLGQRVAEIAARLTSKISTI